MNEKDVVIKIIIDSIVLDRFQLSFKKSFKNELIINNYGYIIAFDILKIEDDNIIDKLGYIYNQTIRLKNKSIQELADIIYDEWLKVIN